MPTPASTLTTPGAGYATADPMIQAKLIGMGAAPASTNSQTQTAAVSYATPGVVEKGAATGATPSGQGIASAPTEIQSYTSPNSQAPSPSAAAPSPSSSGAAVAAYTDSNGVYHPSTTSTDPTAGQVYSGLVPSVDSTLQDAYDAQGNLIKATQAPIDENTIRNNTIAKYQTEIDALNRYYADLKMQRQSAENLLNEGRLGTGAAVQARRGLIGSDFGNAQTDQINENEKSIQQQIANSVDAEQTAAIQKIMGQAQTEADAEIKAKQDAKTKGAQDYIDFLKGAADRKDTRVNNTVANLLTNNVNPDDTTLKSIASQLGIDVPTLKTKIADAKSTAAATAQKNSPKPVNVGGTLYEIQADGTYKAVTPAADEKPIIVGGVAYKKDANGEYKAVTPAATPKPIVRTYKGVTQVSLDNGATWSKSNGAGIPTSGGTAKAKTVSDAAKVSATVNRIQSGIGSGQMTNENGNPIKVGADGKLSPQDYLTVRNAWIADGLSPTTFDTKFKGYRDPANTNYAVGK